MPTDMSGKFHMNPQMARMHDRAAKGSLKTAAKPGEAGRAAEAKAREENDPHPVSHVEFHHHPEGGGKIKSITHYEDGRAEEGEHQNVHEAADHLVDTMGGGDEQESDGAMGDDSPMMPEQQ